MDKNTVCEKCGKHFVEGELIFVVKHDDGETTYLCENDFNEKYGNDVEFREWWDNDTRILSMEDPEEIETEFGTSTFEEINNCSYCTTFENEEE